MSNCKQYTKKGDSVIPTDKNSPAITSETTYETISIDNILQLLIDGQGNSTLRNRP